MNMNEVLLYFSLKYKGVFPCIYMALQTHEEMDADLFDELAEKYLKDRCFSFTTILDDDYPSALKDVNCPPFVLFYIGKSELLDTEKIDWFMAEDETRVFRNAEADDDKLVAFENCDLLLSSIAKAAKEIAKTIN